MISTGKRKRKRDD